jgi:hypothetical protein
MSFAQVDVDDRAGAVAAVRAVGMGVSLAPTHPRPSPDTGPPGCDRGAVLARLEEVKGRRSVA